VVRHRTMIDLCRDFLVWPAGANDVSLRREEFVDGGYDVLCIQLIDLRMALPRSWNNQLLSFAAFSNECRIAFGLP
jgi:hypothetical protein